MRTYENRYKMTKLRYMDWVLHPVPTGKKKSAASNMIWTAFALISIYLAVINFMNKEYVIGACFVFLAAICIISTFFIVKLTGAYEYRKMRKFQGASEWNRVIQFSDKIMFLDGKLKAQYSYDNFYELVNTREYLALRMKKGSYIRLYKDSFKKCTAAEFIEFIKNEHPDIKIRS